MLGKKVRDIRELNGYSVCDFATLMGIDVTRLEAIEDGSVVPNVKELWGLTNKFGLQMNYFLSKGGL